MNFETALITLHSVEFVECDLFFHALLQGLVYSAGIENDAHGQHVEHLVLHLIQHIVFILNEERLKNEFQVW